MPPEDARLDPGTRLLRIGLDAYTPTAALRKLASDSLQMSVALHEITHFTSLDNTLGHILGIFALWANTAANSLMETARASGDIDAESIREHDARRRPYVLLMEAWRPLLEGLAIYVQTHRADERADALYDPVSILLSWKLQVTALSGPLGQDIDDGFLAAVYTSIREGARLSPGSLPLAVSLETVEPPWMRPYFLGHAWVSALQRHLARADPAYGSSEQFVQLMFRILRSSTLRLLSNNPQWDQPGPADRIYNWIDVVSAAPAPRVAALARQEDNVDVLHFLKTGEAVTGYGAYDDEVANDIRTLIPGVWNNLLQSVCGMNLDEIAASIGDTPIEGSDFEIADRILRSWLRGILTLNLTLAGRCRVVGLMQQGFGSKHAVALRVDDHVWWLAAADSDLPLLVSSPADLHRIEQSPLVQSSHRNLPDTGPPVLLGCFASYLTLRGEVDLGERGRLPRVRFQIRQSPMQEESVLAWLAPAVPNVCPPHLEIFSDSDVRSFHSAALELRRMVLNAPAPGSLAAEFEAHGKRTTAAALRASAADQDLAVARVQAHTDRRILRVLLGRVPGTDDLRLLQTGIRMFKSGTSAASFIADAWDTWKVPDSGASEVIHSLNRESEAKIGKHLFEWDAARRLVSYTGLWGDLPGKGVPT